MSLIKKELEQIVKKLNGQIFRSKIRWTEDEEKHSKYFLSLKKKNYSNKLISTLDIDGNIVKDPLKSLKHNRQFIKISILKN